MTEQVQSNEAPLVSCLMPTTHARRQFLPQAIRYFLRQDYPKKELLIVDDGLHPVRDLVPESDLVRYIHLSEQLRLGAKRNRACELASGDILAHWDDDDWHAPHRLSYQIAHLRRGGIELCGLDRMWFYDPKAGKAWQYIYPPGGKKWLAGGSLCFTRELWRRHPFPAVNIGEDNRFVASVPAPKIRTLDDVDIYVALVHNDNTSRKNTTGRRWQSASITQIQKILGEDDAFYTHRKSVANKVYAESKDYESPDHEQSSGAALSGETMKPLVSCIMPTFNRRRFVPDAIRYFKRQDYPNLELLILDDGTDGVVDLIPKDPRIRYQRLSGRHRIGTKRNLACEAARGEIIACWDDDDWYAPHRISYQVAPLLVGEADLTVLVETLFYAEPTGEFWEISSHLQSRMFRQGMVGGTQVFFKKVWGSSTRYREISVTEDVDFIARLSRQKRVVAKMPNDGVFVYVRHSTNSWKFPTGQHVDSRAWKRVERPSFLPDEDLKPRTPTPKSTTTPSRLKTADQDVGTATAPLVSCIMATGNRQSFLQQAVKYFQRQTYENRELVLIDDGKESSAELVPDDDRIRYIRLSSPIHLGTKLNLGIERAKGSIIQKLDDNDYYHPEFLATTVSALLPHPSATAIVGLDCFLVLLSETGELKFSGRGYCAGGSLCFHRQLWEQSPFRDVPRAEDYYFLKDHSVRTIKIHNPELMILVRHGPNHLWKKMGNVDVEDYYRRRPNYRKRLADLIPTSDQLFYDSLKRSS